MSAAIRRVAVLRVVLLTATLCGVGMAGAEAELLEVGFGGKGLASLRYAGVEFLGDGVPRVSSVTLETRARDGDGRTTTAYERASLEGGATRCDVDGKRFVNTYGWGSFAWTYGIGKTRLTIALEISNRGERAIANFSLRPLQLRFAATPDGWDQPRRQVELSLDNVVAVPAVVGSHKVLACLDTVWPAMGFGFGQARDDAKTVYPLKWSGGVPAADRGQPLIHPLGLTRIEPGESRTFTMSLRFAPATTPNHEIVDDVFTKFREIYPALNEWSDRRPIGMLMLICGGKSEKNPRGWFKEPDMDITTAAGKAQFRRLLLDYAARAVKSMKAFGAQGGIVWNVEGEENPHPITYIGDPRMLPVLAPEMDEIADEFFGTFRAAGLRTGVTIRPTQVYFDDGKETWSHGTGSHGPERNPLAESYDEIWPEGLPWWQFFPTVERICRKIEYAKARWGCTIFYVDTNGIFCPVGEKGQFKWLLLNGHVWRSIKERHPDILIIPELPKEDFALHATNWAYGAQYMELDLQGYGTPQHIRQLYPRAFSLINIADGPIEEKRRQLVEAVRNGDILMSRGWFGDHRNAIVKAIYEEAAGGGKQ